MHDLISRQAAFFNSTDDRSPKQVIEALPSAEPERKKGEWIIDKYKAELTCSECKKTFTNFPVIGWKPLWNFCPNCGADMRGESE